MNIKQIRTFIIVLSSAAMSALSLQAAAPKADVYVSYSSGSREFAYQWAHCKIMKNNGDNTESEHRFLKITLAPHIPMNTSTPYDDSERYSRLDKATYRLVNNSIYLHGLNDDSLSIRIKKSNNDSVILSARQGWPKYFKSSVYWEQYWPFNKVAERDLQPGHQLNFKRMQIKRVLDGTSLPRWVLEITIPIDKNEGSEAQKDDGKPEWKQIPAEQENQ